MGFQDLHPIVHQAASRKGGKVRRKKGFARLSKEELIKVSAKGGHAKANRRRSGAIQTQDNPGDNTPRLADVLGDIDEQV